MSNLAIETLIDKRVKLLDEQYKMNQKFNSEIAELNTAIKNLQGEYTLPLPTNETIYDDESPDYIKQSIEEI